MVHLISIDDCLRDTPKFRADLYDNEKDVQQLDARIDKVLKLCNNVIDAARQYIRTNCLFINGLEELVEYIDCPTIQCKQFINTLNEINKYQSILTDQFNRTIGRNFIEFVKGDLHKAIESKKHFDKISDDLDNALLKNSSAPKAKPLEVEEAKNVLTATRSCFNHTAIDYVGLLTVIQSKKHHVVIDSLVSLMHAYGTFFHQGSDLFQDVDPFLKKAVAELSEMQAKTLTLEKEVQSNHGLVSQRDYQQPIHNKGEKIRLEGYLYKRTSNAFKTWHRRWFIIQDKQLVYQKRSHEKELTVMEEDLRLCNVRPIADIDRRFCFEIVSPSKSHVLQADSEELCASWVSVLQSEIDAAYHDHEDSHEDGSEENLSQAGSHDSFVTADSKLSHKRSNSSGSVGALGGSNNAPSKPPRAMNQILSVPGNEKCCDCRAENPKWASFNLGITLCIECSGIHRSFGVHVSKVRSLNLDAWEPESIKIMLALGNNTINQIYEASLNRETTILPLPDCPRDIREKFIRDKYVNKLYVGKDKKVNGSENKQSSESDQDDYWNLELYKAAGEADLIGMTNAIAHGAKSNWNNREDGGQPTLHQAILSKSNVAVEFLLLNGAKCNSTDSKGRSALHLATELGNIGHVITLLKRGAEQNCYDMDGRDALSIAIEKANADIVTLLRLAKLNEEMRDDGSGNDDTFIDVFRDFAALNKSSSPSPSSMHAPRSSSQLAPNPAPAHITSSSSAPQILSNSNSVSTSALPKQKQTASDNQPSQCPDDSNQSKSSSSMSSVTPIDDTQSSESKESQ